MWILQDHVAFCRFAPSPFISQWFCLTTGRPIQQQPPTILVLVLLIIVRIYVLQISYTRRMCVVCVLHIIERGHKRAHAAAAGVKLSVLVACLRCCLHGGGVCGVCVYLLSTLRHGASTPVAIIWYLWYLWYHPYVHKWCIPGATWFDRSK